MTTAVDTQLLSDVILQRTRDAVVRLEENPFYARMLAGTSTRTEYTAWLVQMHKYVRFTARALRGLVTATRGALALYEGLAWYMHERFSAAPSGDES